MIWRILKSLAIGTLLTAGLLALSYFADRAGFDLISQALIWQNTLLQALTPLGNVGTPENPIYEGTPLNFLAFLASIPVGVILYSCAAYFMLGRKGRRS